eukprot:TRINITY_DN3733_c0_g1_i3.p1 TRINITY_DN3733_c0_g1~~TRINITY_DN3733_c0_g1_i3.p1  ORF type:complete len:646 (-),score=89.40 TRINITY_DN3733_c0_g1_i3:81-2018(-)
MAAKVQKTVHDAARLTQKLARAGINPTLTMFYFWSAFIYSMSAILGWFVFYSGTETVLCTVQPKDIECEKCTDNLIMCRKANCWKAALNKTVQDDTLSQAISAFSDAYTDKDCFELVKSALDPVALLEKISSQRASTGGTKPSDACIVMHCKVLQNVLGPDFFGREGQCTDTSGTKLEENRKACSCNSVRLNIPQAQTFEGMCQPMTSQFLTKYWMGMLARKETCFRTEMMALQAATDLAPTIQRMMLDYNCSYIFEKNQATSFQSFMKIHESTVNAYRSLNRPFGAQEDCKISICVAFNNSISKCDWGTAEFRTIDKEFIQAVSKFCRQTPRFPAYINLNYILDAICLDGSNAEQTDLCILWNTTTVFPSVTTTTLAPGAIASGAGAAQRRLTSTRLNASEKALTCGNFVGCGDVEAEQANPMTLERRMQTPTSAPAPPAPPAGEGVQDWKKSAWNKCNCYQQCADGVASRDVICPSGVKCTDPMPAGSKPCKCQHCAKCNVLVFIIAWEVVCLAQALIGLVSMVVFWSISSYDEDDFAGVGFFFKFVGLFCRLLPVIFRFLTLMMVVLVLIFAGFLLPRPETKDCFETRQFRNFSIFALLVWLILVFFGMYMSKKMPRKAWLHGEWSNGTLRKLCWPCGKVGP